MSTLLHTTALNTGYPTPPLLHTAALKTGYNEIIVSGELPDLSIEEGRLICLLGPNGSGKSTLLKTLSGLQPPLNGSINITGSDISQFKLAHLAPKVSLVLTDSIRNSNLTAYSLIALVRYPYSNWLGILRDADKAAIDQAIGA